MKKQKEIIDKPLVELWDFSNVFGTHHITNDLTVQT